MRPLPSLILASVSVLGLSVGASTSALGGEPTPSPTTAPEASQIGMRFLLNGQPYPVTVLTPPDIAADGVGCPVDDIDVPLHVSELSVEWPLAGTGLPSPCTKGPPTKIYLGILTDKGILERHFVWTGDDRIMDVEFGDAEPYPQSTITIRFVKNGDPVTLSSLNFFKGVRADGVECPTISFMEFKGDYYSIRWPFIPSLWAPVECSNGPPMSLIVKLTDAFIVEVPWEGHDVTIDAEVPENDPAIQIVTPSPTPVSSATPAQLPAAGGQPPPAQSNAREWLLAAGATLAAALFTARELASRCRR